MPATIKAAMAKIKYDDKNPQEYLGHIDVIYANLGLGGDATTPTKSATNGDSKEDSVIAAIRAANIPIGQEEAVIHAYRRSGGGHTKVGDNKTKTPFKCYPHRKFGDKAYTCQGGDCVDKGKQLAKKPDNNSSGSF